MPGRLSLSESGLYQNCIHMFVSAGPQKNEHQPSWTGKPQTDKRFHSLPGAEHTDRFSFAQCSLFTKLFILHRSRSCQVGKRVWVLLGGDNFYLDFSPSLCTQFKMTKQEESLFFVVLVVHVLSFLAVLPLTEGKTLCHLSVSLIHIAMVTPIPQYLATK